MTCNHPPHNPPHIYVGSEDMSEKIDFAYVVLRHFNPRLYKQEQAQGPTTTLDGAKKGAEQAPHLPQSRS